MVSASARSSEHIKAVDREQAQTKINKLMAWTSQYIFAKGWKQLHW